MFNKFVSRFGRYFRPFSRHSQENLEEGHKFGGSLPKFVEARLFLPVDSKLTSIELIQNEHRGEPGSSPLRIPLVWLRDHCRSEANYNRKTNQRKADCTELFKRAELAEDCYPIHFDSESQQLRLIWADGSESCFSVQELLDWAIFSRKKQGEECLDEWESSECPSRTLWTGESLKEIPTISCKNIDFPTFARLFIRFGVVAVNGVDARDESATKELCHSISPIHNTFFGDFWTFGTGDGHEQSMAAFEDTAYGQEGIGPHTDGTYLDGCPGIQVFHSLRPAKQGGATILVDGFSAAERLRAERPDLFQLLTELALEHHYLDGKALYARVLQPVIRQFPRAEKVAQIRFNPYDRASMRTLAIGGEEKEARKALEETVLFYEAYQRFARLVNDPGQQVQLRLRPGTVLFIDNFRVLHGREAFQGERTICGCYLSRDCFLAKARPRLSPSLYRNV